MRPSAPVVRAAAVVASALLAGGCVTRTTGRTGAGGGSDGAPLPASDTALPTEAPVSQAPIVLSGRDAGATARGDDDRQAKRKVDAGAAAWKDRFDAALEAASAGEDEAALTLISAALEAGPKPPWDQRFKALKADVKARHVDTNVLRIDVRPLKDYVGFDADVDLLVRVRNVGVADIVFRPPDGRGPDAVSGSTLVLTMRRTDRDIYAAELSRSWTQTVALLTPGAEDLVIPPEGVHELRVRVPAEEVGGSIAGIKVLDLSGELRAGRMSAGIEEPFGRVPVRAGRVVALPANYEPIAADPLRSLSRAVDGLAPVHLLVAAEFLAAEDRPAACGVLARALSTATVELKPAALNALELLRRAGAGTPVRPLAEPLMKALAAHPERAEDVMEGLHVLTLVTLAPDARLWADWWRRETEGPGALLAAEDTSRAAKVVDGGPPKFSAPTGEAPPR